MNDYLTCAHAVSTGWEDDSPEVNYECAIGDISNCAECKKYVPLNEMCKDLDEDQEDSE